MYPLPLVYEEPDEDTLPATLLLDVAVPAVYAVPDDEDVDEEDLRTGDMVLPAGLPDVEPRLYEEDDATAVPDLVADVPRLTTVPLRDTLTVPEPPLWTYFLTDWLPEVLCP